MEEIPKDVAWQLCQQIQKENRGKWLTLGGWQCWGCSTFAKDRQDKRCFNSKEGNRGCNLVNLRYDRMKS
jgi:hypothetical protein